MGKSSASCFKIISCAGESVDHDDLQSPEIRWRFLVVGDFGVEVLVNLGKSSSSDRRRWSFRKRSARHRVLSNSVGSEVPSSVNKENPESPAVNFSLHPDSSVHEKPLVIQLTEETTELTHQLDSKLPENLSAIEDDCKKDKVTFDEPSVVIIQAAIRRLLAQQVVLKQKNIIKLQAAVRGHLVRRHAVGTLRCVQAIIKMQAVVRARLAGRLDNNDPTLLGKKREAKPNTTHTYVSIEKLLTNAFARQLIESTPREKPINIKCDPLRSDSAWKWFERWMSASSTEDDLPEENNLELSDGQEDVLILSSDSHAEFKDMKSTLAASAENNLISCDSTNLDLHSTKSLSFSSSLSDMHEVVELNSTTETAESASVETKETDFIEVVEAKSLPQKDEKTEDEQTESESKKLSRKTSNPAFVAAQSKFEELTSAKLAPSVETDQPFKSTGNGLPDNTTTVISAATSAFLIDSECGTELSISSTLDSPDRSEAGPNEIEQETKVTEHFITEENLETEADDDKKPAAVEADLSYTDTNGSMIQESATSAAVESLDYSTNVEDYPSVEKKQEEVKPSDLQLEVESEASPRSQINFPDFQATPGSQVSSAKPKKKKGKKKSSADKNHNQDSGLKIGLEQLKETKSGKRRNSFGSGGKPEDKEQEPRDSSSSNSLPSYMQATESARAKAIIVNGSPRSSPDLHDKDIYGKKRHSLPGSNERQGSPRIQRSLSQAQQNTKGTAATHSPQGSYMFSQQLISFYVILDLSFIYNVVFDLCFQTGNGGDIDLLRLIKESNLRLFIDLSRVKGASVQSRAIRTPVQN
ncbi:IQ domain-containing protein [Striga asiatica]|uniref:IQ domain-containing protein n=1 Tax=Striga asiatica TaxID=4170 RepID=A0A5A7P1V1_STRAF|nr:IQ domain-containing protein [Striga asiatica]